MPLPDLTTADVLAALAEFDVLGRSTFLDRYGFGEARDYFVRRDGKFYDSKAIVGAAHGVRTGVALTPADFSGGDATVAKLLRELGFEVSDPSPAWTRDEIVLACELVYLNGWRELDEQEPRIVELSSLLRRMSSFPHDRRSPKFRNPNGVARKTSDVMTSHPQYATAKPGRPRVPTKGNRLDGVVVQEFRDNPERMLAEAAAIREAVEALDGEGLLLPEPDLGDAPATEGGVRERRHLVRERDPKLRARKVAASKKANGGRVLCEACGFDFAATYGAARAGEFIECHHTIALSVTGVTTTRIEDLALLCSNCHRMIHVRPPWLTVDELRALIAGQRS